MRNLSYIDLSYNALGGSFPSELGAINHLEMLVLRDNMISGSLPTELALCNGNDADFELREARAPHDSIIEAQCTDTPLRCLLFAFRSSSWPAPSGNV